MQRFVTKRGAWVAIGSLGVVGVAATSAFAAASHVPGEVQLESTGVELSQAADVVDGLDVSSKLPYGMNGSAVTPLSPISVVSAGSVDTVVSVVSRLSAVSVQSARSAGSVRTVQSVQSQGSFSVPSPVSQPSPVSPPSPKSPVSPETPTSPPSPVSKASISAPSVDSD